MRLRYTQISLSRWMGRIGLYRMAMPLEMMRALVLAAPGVDFAAAWMMPVSPQMVTAMRRN